jgi:alpha-L-arabinofuranosidase
MAKKGFTQWTTDMLFFDNVNIVKTPNYYVQKLFMNNRGAYYFNGVVQADKADTLNLVSCVLDKNTGDVILKIVNAGSQNKTVKVDLSRFKHIKTTATQTVFSGSKSDENTFDLPNKIVPVESQINLAKKFDYAAPAMSLTVIRFNSK